MGKGRKKKRLKNKHKKKQKKLKKKIKEKGKKMTHYSGYTHGSETKLVFTHDGIRYHGSSKSHLNDSYLKFDDKELLVNATGIAFKLKPPTPPKPFVKSCPSWFKSEFGPFEVKDTKEKEVESQILLDWKDFQPPPDDVDLGFWQDIISMAKDNGIKDIVFCCQGGKGRTGTALASAAIASGFMDEPKEAIDMVRKEFVKEAIERDSQELYVWSLVYDLEAIFDMEKEAREKDDSEDDEELPPSV